MKQLKKLYGKHLNLIAALIIISFGMNCENESNFKGGYKYTVNPSTKSNELGDSAKLNSSSNDTIELESKIKSNSKIGPVIK